LDLPKHTATDIYYKECVNVKYNIQLTLKFKELVGYSNKTNLRKDSQSTQWKTQ